MAAVFDHDLASGNHRANKAPAGHEQECVKPVVWTARKIGIFSVEKNEVCPAPGLDRANRLRKRLGAASEPCHIQALSGRFALMAGEHIARPMQQTLAI